MLSTSSDSRAPRSNKQLREHTSDEELKTELERLPNENAALKKGASQGIRLKVSEKGAVSVYGMGALSRDLV